VPGAFLGILTICAIFARFPAVCGAEVLKDFRPSTVESRYGATSLVEFETGTLTLEPGSLTQHADGAIRHYRFEEAVWIIGYRTEVIDDVGKPARENYLCHTFLGDQMVDQKHDREIVGVYSDQFTSHIRLPDGFGLYFAADENVHWMAMFNNRGERPVRVRMKATLTLVRERDRSRPLRKVYSTLRSVQVPHLYFVPPGRHEQSATFQLPFEGRVHFLGSHLHPHGVSMELVNVALQETVWKGMAKKPGGMTPPATNPRDEMSGVGVYSNPDGYPVKAGDRFRLTAVYDNPTREVIDAMAGVYIFYSRN
jgi:hypothetical protein